MPGPISSTSRTGESADRAATIDRATPWSVKKCCPRAFFALTSIGSNGKRHDKNDATHKNNDYI